MKYNLVVAGGGLSGVAAAVSAAREGLKVLLVEKSGCLGGAIANNLVYPFMPYWTKPYWEKNVERNYLSQGISKEMLSESIDFNKINAIMSAERNKSFKLLKEQL